MSQNQPPGQPPYPEQGQQSPYPQQGQQPPYPPQGQQGYYQPGPPPKKKHTVRNVLLVLVLLFILFVAGCIALVGKAANDVSKSIDKSLANDKPTTVSMGKAFTHDGYQIKAGWSLGKEKYTGDAIIRGLTVTNTQKSDSSGRTALLTFRFYKGKQNLAEVQCTGKELQKGESGTMDCSSTDKYPTGYDTVKVADMF